MTILRARKLPGVIFLSAAQCVQGCHEQAPQSHRTCNQQQHHLHVRSVCAGSPSSGFTRFFTRHVQPPTTLCGRGDGVVVGCTCGVKQQCVQGCHDQASQAASHRTCTQQQHYLHGRTRRQLFGSTVCLALVYRSKRHKLLVEGVHVYNNPVVKTNIIIILSMYSCVCYFSKLEHYYKPVTEQGLNKE